MKRSANGYKIEMSEYKKFKKCVGIVLFNRREN